MRSFLKCSNAADASVKDAAVAAYLRAADRTTCNAWSGVYVKRGLIADTYAILWGAEVGEALGISADDPAIIEDSNDSFEPYVPPAPAGDNA